MERTLLCEIVTPERIVYTNEVRMVIATTIDGEIGILPLHAPLVSALAPGEIRVVHTDGEVEWFAVSGGYIQVYLDKVIVLADHAEAASTIELERALEALEHSKRRMSELESDDQGELTSCIADLKWCEAQLKVAEKQRS